MRLQNGCLPQDDEEPDRRFIPYSGGRRRDSLGRRGARAHDGTCSSDILMGAPVPLNALGSLICPPLCPHFVQRSARRNRSDEAFPGNRRSIGPHDCPLANPC